MPTPGPLRQSEMLGSLGNYDVSGSVGKNQNGGSTNNTAGGGSGVAINYDGLSVAGMAGNSSGGAAADVLLPRQFPTATPGGENSNSMQENINNMSQLFNLARQFAMGVNHVTSNSRDQCGANNSNVNGNSIPNVSSNSSNVINNIPNVSNNFPNVFNNIPNHPNVNNSIPNHVNNNIPNVIPIIPNVNNIIPGGVPNRVINNIAAPGGQVVDGAGQAIVNGVGHANNVIPMPNIPPREFNMNGFAPQPGINIMPITSIYSPIGEEIPQVLKDKITSGLFIDFALLLGKDTPSNNAGQPLSVGVNSSGQFVIHEKKAGFRISSIQQWTNAFFIYAGIYLRAHPNRTQELLKYGQTIRMLAARYTGWGWMDYDRNFRQRMQIYDRSWAAIDGELWSLYVCVPQVPAQAMGNSNGNQGRCQGSQGQRRGGYAGASSSRNSTSSGYCFAFNRGNCADTNCTWKHICSVCFKTGHCARNCSAGRGGKRSNNSK